MRIMETQEGELVEVPPERYEEALKKGLKMRGYYGITPENEKVIVLEERLEYARKSGVQLPYLDKRIAQLS